MGELGPRGCAGTLGGDISTTILESSLPEEHWPLPGKQRERNLYQALKQGTCLKKKRRKRDLSALWKKKNPCYMLKWEFRVLEKAWLLWNTFWVLRSSNYRFFKGWNFYTPLPKQFQFICYCENNSTDKAMK